jgi:hypothetical protein
MGGIDLTEAAPSKPEVKGKAGAGVGKYPTKTVRK